MQPSAQQRMGVVEAPAADMTRLIGVELTLRNRMTGESCELEMLAVQHTFPNPRGGPYGYGLEMQVTLHTSDGDRAANIQL